MSEQPERKMRSTRVYEALRDEILRGDLKPGTRLVAREIGTKHGVSDIPVREALWVLSREGLVETSPYSGARVAELTRTEVMEVLVVRANLEGLATSLAASQISEAVLADLDGMLVEMAAVVDSAQPDPLQYAALNRRFHATIFDSCGNGRLVHTIQLLWEGHSQLQAVFRLNPDRLRNSLQEHRAIVAALKDRDADLAGALAAEHKQLQKQDLLMVMQAERQDDLA
jgi:DNA-binding GntR family transcriptional regulator